MATQGNGRFKFFLIFLVLVLLAVASYFYLSETAVEQVQTEHPTPELDSSGIHGDE